MWSWWMAWLEKEEKAAGGGGDGGGGVGSSDGGRGDGVDTDGRWLRRSELEERGSDTCGQREPSMTRWMERGQNRYAKPGTRIETEKDALCSDSVKYVIRICN